VCGPALTKHSAPTLRLRQKSKLKLASDPHPPPLSSVLLSISSASNRTTELCEFQRSEKHVFKFITCLTKNRPVMVKSRKIIVSRSRSILSASIFPTGFWRVQMAMSTFTVQYPALPYVAIYRILFTEVSEVQI